MFVSNFYGRESQPHRSPRGAGELGCWEILPFTWWSWLGPLGPLRVSRLFYGCDSPLAGSLRVPRTRKHSPTSAAQLGIPIPPSPCTLGSAITSCTISLMSLLAARRSSGWELFSRRASIYGHRGAWLWRQDLALGSHSGSPFPGCGMWISYLSSPWNSENLLTPDGVATEQLRQKCSPQHPAEISSQQNSA